MKINYVTPAHEAVFYKTLSCGDTFYDEDSDLNIKVSDTLSIFMDGEKWHPIDRCESETVYPVPATLTVEE